MEVRSNLSRCKRPTICQCALQVAQDAKADILALQGGTASTVPATILDIARQVPTSVLIWRDLEARAAQLRNMTVAEVPEEES